MGANEAIADVTSRIAAIQARFGMPASATATTPFSRVLAAATLGSTGTGSATSAGLVSAASTNVTGQSAVDSAEKYLGVPYVWGGADPSTGLDCSGLVQRAYADLGVDLPRVAADQARQGTPVASLADARPGDLVAFGSPVDHIGMYAGDGKMVVAPHRGASVEIETITTPPTAIRRIIPDTSTTGKLVVGPWSAGRLALGATSATANSGTTALTGAATGTGIGPGPSAYDGLFASAGAKYGLSPQLLSAVAKTESGYDPSAVSPAGAEGLMQLMPDTAQSLGVDPLDPTQAVDGAARLLAGHLQKFGSVDLALAAYNAGGGAVTRYGGIPPFPETQTYVRRVLAYAGATT
jgi:cell wall-associated NlpC family hydrolase